MTEDTTESEWEAWDYEAWLAAFCVRLYRLAGVRVMQVPADIDIRGRWQEGMDADGAAVRVLWEMGRDVYFGDGEAFE